MARTKLVEFEAKYFTLEEMTRSEIAKQRGIKNEPDPINIECLNKLCKDILDPLRIAMCCPIIVNSAFRCAQLNKYVPGSSWKSQHMVGLAADIRCHSETDTRLLPLRALEEDLPFDQMILYDFKEQRDNPEAPATFTIGFMHISTCLGDQRNELLLKDPKTNKYTHLDPKAFLNKWHHLLSL